MRILVSLSYSRVLDFPATTVGGHQLVPSHRSSDWGMAGLRRQVHCLRESLRILRQARNYDALVLCNAGIEPFFVARWRPLICPRTRLVMLDVLMPREGRFVNLVRPWLKAADAFIVIRTGDVPALERRFGVRPEQCHFAPFPINERAAALPTTEGDYVYSAGWAHRDWPTLVRALSGLPYRGVICSGFPIEVPAGCNHIETPPMPGPDEGRQLMANARVVVLPLEDTDLPAGPLVLLDAMAAGKAVVATRVNGTRDYVEDGRTALVVPPADPDAMAAAIRRLMEEDTLRREIGRRAREDVRGRCTMENMLSRVVEVCAGDSAPVPAPVARVEAASGARR